MDFNLNRVDFEGSLRNPMILISAMVLAVVIAQFLVGALRLAVRQAWMKAAFALAAAGSLSFASSPLTRIVATGFYAIVGYPGAGLIGGPPRWFCPLLAIILTPFLFVASRIFAHFRRRRLA